MGCKNKVEHIIEWIVIALIVAIVAFNVISTQCRRIDFSADKDISKGVTND